ncbi:DeoR/GlpR family DNA-binding transcription regulator [Frigidibacter sp. MR17.24]|uniref:DeoR/GlpR family DNA-binding transcription regulator n=1 Tax=Frigidibacter sp. MR17.24 TaxID=3127345 RepID=UPI003012C6DB
MSERLRKTERQERILLELRLRSHLRIADLAEGFGVATETIRRDVAELEAAGRLNRAFGGVTGMAADGVPDVETRNRARKDERERIARRALQLVRPGDTIMIDAGSTTQQLARALAFAGIRVTVITNSLNVALILGQGADVTVRVCPGDLLPGEAAVTGTDTIDYLRRFNAATAFVGASAVGPRGVTEAVPGFAAVKRAMHAQSDALVVLADASKFGMTHSDTVAALSAGVTLVTSDWPAPDTLAGMRAGGATILV